MANARLALVSGVASGASNKAHYLDTANAFSAGDLFQVMNQGTEKAAIDYAGNLDLAGALVVSAATPTASTGEVAIGTTTSATVGAAGGAAALPATPTGYLTVNIGGTAYKIPYYAAS